MIRFDCRGQGGWSAFIAQEATKLGFEYFSQTHQVITVKISTLDQLRLLLNAIYKENCGYEYVPVQYQSVTMELLG
jgi:hypothetical protein